MLDLEGISALPVSGLLYRLYYPDMRLFRGLFQAVFDNFVLQCAHIVVAGLSCNTRISTSCTTLHTSRKRTFDLFYGTREPLSGTKEPEADRVHDDDAHGDDRVVQCLRVDGVRGGQDERDGDEDDAADRDHADRDGEYAEMERPTLEVFCVYDAQCNGDTYVFGGQLMRNSIAADGAYRRRCIDR